METPSGPEHEEALARLDFLLSRGVAGGLVLGPRGSGKTRLLAEFARRCRRRGLSTALVPLPGDRSSALFALAGQWGLAPAAGETDAALWRLVTDRMVEHRYEQRGGVVLLDDGEQTGAELVPLALALLSAAEAAGSSLLLVIALPGSELARVSADLLARMELRIELEPWPAELPAAAAPRTENPRDSIVFVSPGKLPELDPAAVARLHELAEGIPRSIDQLSELTLRFGGGS